MIANYADHSANERTFLARVRTAIAVVGFGIGATASERMTSCEKLLADYAKRMFVANLGL